MIIIRFLNNLWASVFSVSSNLSAISSSYAGLKNIFEDDCPLEGTTTLTTASSMITSNVNVDVNTYNTSVSQAYVECMDETELNELVEKLENIEIEDKPKTLTKTINNKYHI